MRNSDLGFEKKNVVVLNYPHSGNNTGGKYDLIRHEFASVPGVIDVSGAYTLPGINNKETLSVLLPGKPDNEYNMFGAIGVDYGFIPALGLQLIKGRNFSEKLASDTVNSIILNETAVKELGLKHPLGAEVLVPGNNNSRKAVKVIGVIKNFHVTSFYNKIEPMLLYINPARYYKLALKIGGENNSKILAELKSVWLRIFPGKDFEYTYLEQTYNDLYRSDEKTGNMFIIFSAISILIACLGLFGLVSYTIEVKTKEIGIRKVLGAGFKNIVFLLTKEFIKWTLIANIFAWPLAYIAVSKWLDNFAYKTDVGVTVFILSGTVAFLIALTTVGIQAMKAASSKPVSSLKYE